MGRRKKEAKEAIALLQREGVIDELKAIYTRTFPQLARQVPDLAAVETLRGEAAQCYKRGTHLLQAHGLEEEDAHEVINTISEAISGEIHEEFCQSASRAEQLMVMRNAPLFGQDADAPDRGRH